MKTLNGVTSRTHLPHGLFDNQQTHYDSVRCEDTSSGTKCHSHHLADCWRVTPPAGSRWATTPGSWAASGTARCSLQGECLLIGWWCGPLIGFLCNCPLLVAVPRCQTDHLADVLAGNYGWSVQSTGMGGPTADQKFYDPERVRNIVNSLT